VIAETHIVELFRAFKSKRFLFYNVTLSLKDWH